MFRNLEISGVKTKIIPEQVAEKNITIAAGITLGSNTSFMVIRRWFNLNLFLFSRVSLMLIINNPDSKATPEATKKSTFIPNSWQIIDPNPWPIPMPREIKVPQIPIALPRFSFGKISVNNAVAPVGKNPALKPCRNRRQRKKNTVIENG